MSKDKIGIFFSPNKSLGGGYQYAVSILEALLKSGKEIYVFNASSDLPEMNINKNRVHIINVWAGNASSVTKLRDSISYFLAYTFPWLIRLVYELGLFNLLNLFLKFANRKLIRLIDSVDLDLVFFPIPIYLSTMLHTPVVVSVLDLEHRFKGNFRETSAGGRWEYREFGYKKIAKKAWRILVDSEKSKNNMERFYDAKQTTVLKYVPPSSLVAKLPGEVTERAQKKFNLTSDYVFYPAKFWPHKNHIVLLKALEILKRKKIPVELVFTGSKEADFSTFDEVQKYIRTHGLEEDVKYFGYVSTDELSYLYLNSLCLAMPTLMGPTYIPVYEGWKMGTPVIYSDIEGCREQLGDAGLLVNPKRPVEIADAIERLYRNLRLRRTLVKRGFRRLASWTEKDFRTTILSVIKDYEHENN